MTSQEQAIIERLSETPNCWVSLMDLYHVSGSMAVHSRAASLRRKGYRIINMVDRSKRPNHSFYQLKK